MHKVVTMLAAVAYIVSSFRPRDIATGTIMSEA